MSYSALAKHVIYPISQIYTRNDTLKNFRKIEKTQWFSVDKIERIQWRKLKHLLKHAFNTVPFYHRIFTKLNMTPKDITTPDNFRKLPLLSKEEIRNNYSHIVSLDYTTRDLIPNSTGGSTGVNLNFFNDGKTTGNRRAVVLRNDRWAGFEIGDKNARLWGSRFDISLQDNLKSKIYNRLFRTILLSSYDLSHKNMMIYAKKLFHFKPKVIIAYPSPLYHFAEFLKENGIRGINPKSIISSAEVLYKHQRELIESVFQCKVFNRYGCREFAAIAQECSQHLGMHINSEHVYVECLQGDGEPTSHGERGELVVTDLDNYGMPFIRYRIDDVGVLSERKCNCGRGLSILEKIEGRAFDIVIGTNGRAVGGTFWTLLLRTAIEGIKQFQVVQESLSELDIRIVAEESFEERRISTLVDKIREYLGKDMKITFQVVDKIPLTKSGKSRFVVSKIVHSLA
ncbi:MAG: phenylacetate--CoA ligase family protein [Candidatus Hermodarchaeota archaeon]